MMGVKTTFGELGGILVSVQLINPTTFKSYNLFPKARLFYTLFSALEF
jgi:hypothetical protein